MRVTGVRLLLWWHRQRVAPPLPPATVEAVLRFVESAAFRGSRHMPVQDAAFALRSLGGRLVIPGVTVPVLASLLVKLQAL